MQLSSRQTGCNSLWWDTRRPLVGVQLVVVPGAGDELPALLIDIVQQWPLLVLNVLGLSHVLTHGWRMDASGYED